jgi:hypothetical protein
MSRRTDENEVPEVVDPPGGATIWHILVCLLTPGALPPLWWGPCGIVKTSLIEQAYEAYLKLLNLLAEQYPLETMIASQCDPTDFRGIPVPGDGNSVNYVPATEFQHLSAAGKGWLFLDEISNCMPAVQASMLRIVHKRIAGLLKLNDEVRIAAAANPVEEAAGGYDQADSMGNRWTHLVTTVTDVIEHTDDWLNHMEFGVTKATEIPVFSQEQWEREYVVTVAAMARFIRSNPKAQQERRGGPDGYAGRTPLAFASHRSWENVARLHATLRCLGREDDLEIFARGSIGPVYSIQYARFVAAMDLPDPETLIADPMKAKSDPRRPDRDYTTVRAVATLVTAKIKKADAVVDDTTMKRYVAAWKVVGRFLDTGAGKELVAQAAMMLVERRPEGGIMRPEVRAVSDRLASVTRKAGAKAA